MSSGLILFEFSALILGGGISMMASNVNTSEYKHPTKNEHCIYKNDPLEQKSLINNVVQVTRVDGKKMIGTVFTVDPVSESIVLVTKNTMTDEISMDIVMGHAISCVDKLTDVAPIPLDNVFPSSNPAASLVGSDIAARRALVKAWLLKNRLPIEEDGDVLKLDKALQIFPPYSSKQCISDNEIILGKVQELIMTMPEQI